MPLSRAEGTRLLGGLSIIARPRLTRGGPRHKKEGQVVWVRRKRGEIKTERETCSPAANHRFSLGGGAMPQHPLQSNHDIS